MSTHGTIDPSGARATGLTTRRVFLKSATLALAPLFLRPAGASAAGPVLKPLKFFVCADAHKDFVPDADSRLKAFIDAAKSANADFIIQLGDFCRPYEKNREFLKIWEGFPGARYHTLGNHDRDGGFTWKTVMEFWGMQKPYYSFDRNGWHFVVLDGNEKNPKDPAPGYPRYIGSDQIAWLEQDLQQTLSPAIVFSHQSIEDPECVQNGPEVRQVLEQVNSKAGWSKAAACLSGHSHIDFQRQINGIHYVQINSLSYSWLGRDYPHVRYGPEVDKAYPNLKYTAPYKDPLFAAVTLNPSGSLMIQGRKTDFVGPTPWELGMPDRKGTSRDKERLVPAISNRSLRLMLASQKGVGAGL